MSLTSWYHSRYGLIVKVRIRKETICSVCQFQCFQKDDQVTALGIGRHQLGRIPTTTYVKSKCWFPQWYSFLNHWPQLTYFWYIFEVVHYCTKEERNCFSEREGVKNALRTGSTGNPITKCYSVCQNNSVHFVITFAGQPFTLTKQFRTVLSTYRV